MVQRLTTILYTATAILSKQLRLNTSTAYCYVMLCQFLNTTTHHILTGRFIDNSAAKRLDYKNTQTNTKNTKYN